MQNKRTKQLVAISFLIFLLIPLMTLFASCGCKDTSTTGIKVIVNGTEISQETGSIKMKAMTNLKIEDIIKVFTQNKNGDELEIALKTENADGFEIIGNLPNPITFGTYNLEIKYADFTSSGFKLIIERGVNTIKNVSDISKTYDGEPVSAPTFELDFEQETKIEYFAYPSRELLSAPPTNAGHYLVKITALENALVAKKEYSQAFAISKAFANIETTHTPFNIEYSSTRKLADLELGDGFSWVNPNETPTCQKNRYQAQYNPDPQNFNGFIFEIDVNVSKKSIALPNPNLTYIFNNQVQTFDIAPNEAYEITNNTRREVGQQQVTVSLLDTQNYCWTNGENSQLTFTFEIQKAMPQMPNLSPIQAIPNQPFSELTLPTGYSWDSENGENVGGLGEKRFTVTFTPTDINNYLTIANIEVIVNVSAIIQIPSPKNSSLTFNQTAQTIELNNLNSEYVEIIGETTQTNAGNYSLTARLKYPAQTVWSDNTNENKTISWEIKPLEIELAKSTSATFQASNLEKVYNGNALWQNTEIFGLENATLPFCVLNIETQEDVSSLFEGQASTYFEICTTDNLFEGLLKIYLDETLTTLKSTPGTGYVSVAYALKANSNIVMTSPCELLYVVTITNATLSFSGTLYTENASEALTLNDVAVMSLNTQINAQIASNELSLDVSTQSIVGYWYWENGILELTESGTYAAIYYPIEHFGCFQPLTAQVFVDITPPDNIVCSVQLGNQLPQNVERNGNIFTLNSKVATKTHTIKFELPENCTATYSINDAEAVAYSTENGIILLENPSLMPFENIENYFIQLFVSGDVEKTLTLSVSIEQTEYEILVNGEQIQGSTINTGDELEIILHNEFSALNKILINNEEISSLIVSSKTGAIDVELLENETPVMLFNLNIVFVPPRFILDSNQSNEFNITISTMSGFTHYLREGQTELDLEIQNINFNTTEVSYSIDNINFTPLTTSTLSQLNVEEISRIYFVANINSVELFRITIILQKFSRINSITYTKIDNSAYSSNLSLFSTDLFLKSIVPTFNKENLEYELLTTSGTPLDLNSVDLYESSSFDYVLKVYSQGKTQLLEEHTYTINYSFTFSTSIPENTGILLNDNQITIIAPLGQEFTLSLYSSFPPLQTLTLFNIGGQQIENNLLCASEEPQQLTAKIMNTLNSCFIEFNIVLYSNSSENIEEIFNSTSVTITINENFTKNISFGYSITNSISLEPLINITEFISALETTLTSELTSNEYSLSCNYTEENELLIVSVIKNSETTARIFFKIYWSGESNNNTAITIQARSDINNDTPIVTQTPNTNEFYISNIKSSSAMIIQTENRYALIKLYLAESVESISPANLVMSGTESIYYVYEQDATYVAEILATDGITTEYYLIHISGTIEPFVSVTIGTESYEAFIVNSGITGELQERNGQGSYELFAVLSQDLINGKTSLDVEINTFSTLALFDSNDNPLSRNSLISLDITEASGETPAFIMFKVQIQDQAPIKCYVYFE